MTQVFKPTYVVEDLGELARLPNGGIINAGGVSGNFTVAGQAVILKDGTASDGSGQVIVTSGSGANLVGHEYVQAIPQTIWHITHNRATKKIQLSIWSETDELIFADVVQIIDVNNVVIIFSTPQAGRADLVLFS